MPLGAQHREVFVGSSLQPMLEPSQLGRFAAPLVARQQPGLGLVAELDFPQQLFHHVSVAADRIEVDVQIGLAGLEGHRLKRLVQALLHLE